MSSFAEADPRLKSEESGVKMSRINLFQRGGRGWGGGGGGSRADFERLNNNN